MWLHAVCRWQANCVQLHLDARGSPKASRWENPLLSAYNKNTKKEPAVLGRLKFQKELSILL